MSPFIYFSSAFISCVCLLFIYRRLAVRAGFLDEPNSRSLHAVARPSGGGFVIALVALAVQALLIVSHALPILTGMVWLLCGFAIALLGWIDDRRHQPAIVRLIWQLFIAAVFVSSIDIAPYIGTHLGVPISDPVATVLCVIGIVWMVNLSNFIDGADGFAATGALLAFGFGAWLALRLGENGFASAGFGLVGAYLGFLLWNWQPARLFMGDVGSYFLGFQFAAFLLLTVEQGLGVFVWTILLAPFITDTSLTLGRRILSKKSWWQPHSTHVYQLCIHSGWSHAGVTYALAGISISVLWPLAYVAAEYPTYRWEALATTYGFACIIWSYSYSRLRTSLLKAEG